MTNAYKLLLIIILMLNKTISTPASTNLIVTRVGPCSDRNKDIIKVSEMCLSKNKNELSISGKVTIPVDIENGWYIKGVMQKCHDIRNLDTCDFYKAISVIKNGCEESDDEDVYNRFFGFVTPKLDCPIKAGHYNITDYPFVTKDKNLTSVESKISTSVFGYMYRVEGYDDNDDRFLCIEAHIRMIYVREHDWVGNKRVGVKSTTPSITTTTEDEGNMEENAPIIDE